jgi:hypothetical protein
MFYKKKKNLMHTKAHHVSVCHTYAPVSYGLMQNFGGSNLLVDHHVKVPHGALQIVH